MSRLPFRPEGYSGSLEKHLPQIQNAVVKSLTKTQKELTHDTLKLEKPLLKTLAAVLVEFAEDLHCGIGIWHSLERSNRKFFGTPLPFVLEAGAPLPADAISPARMQHFLWVLYPQLIPNIVLSPDHIDLLRLAKGAAVVLQERFADAPEDSGVKQFLGLPNDYGWEVKQKLIWLGTQSYLFRTFFKRYVEEQDTKVSEIAVTDDFLCQECTRWSGLGVLDILAGVLDLPGERRADLLSWSERHNAVYKVLSGDKERIEVRNIINDARYRVHLNLGRNPFTRGSFVYGSLVPWGGEWYWSGEQRILGQLDAAAIDQLKQSYRKQPSIFYRYSPEDLKKARELVRGQYEEFVARHGKDWVVFPDGLAMAADWQKAAQEKIASLPPAERKKFMDKHGLKKHFPEMNLPPELLESKHGMGVYFNPDEGMEIFEDFNDILAALKKKGVSLTPDEGEAIRQWVWSESISPGFVRRVAEEYGSESIRAAFLLANHDEHFALEYLLRRYKGTFYRPRYPTLTIVA